MTTRMIFDTTFVLMLINLQLVGVLLCLKLKMEDLYREGEMIFWLFLYLSIFLSLLHPRIVQFLETMKLL